MIDQKFRQTIQIITAKLALGIKLTVKEKKAIIRHRAQSIVRAGRGA